MADKREMLINALRQDPASISNTPRSRPMVGVLADLLKPLAQDSQRIEMGESTLGDTIGLPKTQELLDDLSYGKPFFRGGSLQTATPDPRLKDVLNFGAMIAPTKLMGIRK